MRCVIETDDITEDYPTKEAALARFSEIVADSQAGTVPATFVFLWRASTYYKSNPPGFPLRQWFLPLEECRFRSCVSGTHYQNLLILTRVCSTCRERRQQKWSRMWIAESRAK